MAPPPLPTGSPSLMDELIEEILLRLPPDEPACFFRSSLVCKLWRKLICKRHFLGRLQQLHKRPPVLGLLQNTPAIGSNLFIPTMASTFSLAVPPTTAPQEHQSLDYRHGCALPFEHQALDYRHGCVLLLCDSYLIVWDPIAGDLQRVLVPKDFLLSGVPTAALICTADGCDHRGCRAGPFRIVYVFHDGSEGDGDGDEYSVESFTSVAVYSSKTNRWDKSKSINNLTMFFREHTTSILVGKSLLYFLSDGGNILQFDLASGSMMAIPSPFVGKVGMGIHLILWEDGGLGAADSSSLDSNIQLWSMYISDHGNSKWVMSRVICLDNSLSGVGLSSTLLKVMGFAEGANAILFSTTAGVFTFDLQSERIRKLCKDDAQAHTFFPISSFYIPSPTKLKRAKRLFKKGYKAIQSRNFTNAVDFLSHVIEIRVDCYGKFAPECAIRVGQCVCALYEEDSVPLKKGGFEEGQNSNGKYQEAERTHLAYEMMALATQLVEKRPDNTMEEVKILSTVAKICLKREGVESSLSFFLKALTILEHLVESGDRQIVELTSCICSVLEVPPKIGDVIHETSITLSSEVKRYEFIRLCRTHIQNLKKSRDAILADKGDNPSAGEGDSEKPTLEDGMMSVTGRLAELDKKLEDLERALSSLISMSHDSTV